MICSLMDPEEKYAMLRSSGFINERQIYLGETVCVWDLAVLRTKGGLELGLASRVIYYLKDLDRFQVSEPAGQVEGVAFHFSPLS